MFGKISSDQIMEPQELNEYLKQVRKDLRKKETAKTKRRYSKEAANTAGLYIQRYIQREIIKGVKRDKTSISIDATNIESAIPYRYRRRLGDVEKFACQATMSYLYQLQHAGAIRRYDTNRIEGSLFVSDYTVVHIDMA